MHQDVAEPSLRYNTLCATADRFPSAPIDFCRQTDSACPILSSTKGSKLLWVDDSNILLSLYKAVFEKFGFVVSAVSSPTEALKEDSLAIADVAILDFDMPEMNGAELARRIKERHPYLPVILYSGSSSMPESTNRFVDAICTKGMPHGEFLAVIEKLVCGPHIRLTTVHRPSTFTPSSNH